MRLKILSFAILFFIQIMSCVSADSYSDYLSNIEQNLFNIKFENENINVRLDRIENNIFGKIIVAPKSQRINNLSEIYSFSSENSIKPVAYKRNSSDIKKEDFSYMKPIEFNPDFNLSQQSSVTYPAVDQMEIQIFKRTFKNEDIYKRTERLEIAVFKRNFKDEISSRVDRLKDTILGNYNANPDSDEPQTVASTIPSMDKDSINILLGKLEQETFKSSYPNDPVKVRLDRLENSVFNQTSSADPIEDRIERLSSVIAAKPTSSLYKDVATLNKYQNINSQLTVATVILLILKGLLF